MDFTFDPASGKYRAPNGRFVRETVVLAALDAVIAAQAVSMRDSTQQLIDGTIALALWQAQAMNSIKAVHLVATSVAVGGWRQMDQEWLGWTGRQIRTQYDWLLKFSVELGNGVQPLNGTAVARAALYAHAARGTNREAQRRLARIRMIAGEERRRLGVADHCLTCLEQARLKWQPFGTLKRIGDSECRTNCRCVFEFRPALAAA